MIETTSAHAPPCRPAHTSDADAAPSGPSDATFRPLDPDRTAPKTRDPRVDAPRTDAPATVDGGFDRVVLRYASPTRRAADARRPEDDRVPLDRARFEALYAYTGNHVALNAALRARGTHAKTDTLDAALAQIAAADGPRRRKTFRGTSPYLASGAYETRLSEGTTSHDLAYLSTSYDPARATTFGDHGTLQILFGRSGIDVRAFSRHDEQEVLYPRGTEFRVLFTHEYRPEDHVHRASAATARRGEDRLASLRRRLAAGDASARYELERPVPMHDARYVSVLEEILSDPTG